MDLFMMTKLILAIGIVTGLLLAPTKNLGKLVTGLLAVLGSITGFIYAIQVLLQSSFGTNATVGAIDALSVFFVGVISFISIFTAIYAFGYLEEYRLRKNLSILGALYNAFILAMLLVVTAQSTYTFLIAWEAMSLISYFLVLTDYEKESVRKAGFIYVVMTHVGTAFIILGFLLLGTWTGGADYAHFATAKVILTYYQKSVLFILFLVGFGTKAGIIPLHIWLPRAHPVAPSHISALMSGVMIKVAIYGMIRVIFSFLGTDYAWWGEVILVIGVASALLGVLYAVMQHDLKRLLAYSSVENIGIILMALGLAIILSAYQQQTLAAWALLAAIFHLLNHAVFKGLLFMGAGAIHKATHTKDMELLGGLIKVMPLTALCFLTGAMAISALPPLNGFMSEWLIYQGLISAGIILPVVWVKMLIIFTAASLALTGALAAYCFVKAFGMTFLAMPRSEKAQQAKEASPAMLVGMGGLALSCVGLGVFSPHVLRIILPVVQQTTKVQLSIAGGMFRGIEFSDNLTKVVPIAIFALLVFLGIILFFSARKFARYKKIRRSETWACGIHPTSRMQYTATSFSQPLRIVFRSILRPEKELTKEGDADYFLESMHYNTSMKPVYEDYFYHPINKLILYLSQKFRLIQSGQIQLYVIYIFLALIFLLLWAL